MRSISWKLRLGLGLALCLLGWVGPGRAEIKIQAEDLLLVKPPDQPRAEGDTPEKAPANRVVEEALEFLNGDKLRGRLAGIEADGTVQWNHPEAKSVIQFNTRNLSKVSLDPNAGRGKNEDGFSVRLTNGNEIPGKLVSLDNENLTMTTWYAGTLTINRKMIASIRPLRAGNLLYEGPVSIDEWTTGRGGAGKGWQYRDGSLVSSRPGLIGRDMKLPEMAKIDFELSWSGNLGLLVSLYAPNVESYSSNCYLLQMNAGYIYLNRSSNRGGQNNLGQTQVDELSRKNKTRVGLRINKEQKTIALLLDGVLAKQWRDPGEFAGTGGGLAFYAQGQGAMTISRLQITEWDGRMDDAGATDGPGPEQDTISLVNRDKVSGTIEKISDGKLFLKSAFAPLEVPLERLDRIEMAGQKIDAGKEEEGMVRIGLPNEGNILVKVDRMTRDRAVVTSPAFGKAEMRPEAFRSIEFNLKKERQSNPDEVAAEEVVDE
jgi:hypothetical protein